MTALGNGVHFTRFVTYSSTPVHKHFGELCVMREGWGYRGGFTVYRALDVTSISCRQKLFS